MLIVFSKVVAGYFHFVFKLNRTSGSFYKEKRV